MGYIRHHSIVVTTFDDDSIKEAHQKAKNLFGHVSEIVKSSINGYMSFFIAPDGSKEGWPDSDTGDKLRKEFIDWIEEGEESRYLDYVEVFYGDDNGNCMIVNYN